MDEKINKKLSFLGNTQLALLANSTKEPMERYNTISNLYLSNDFLENAGVGSLSLVLLKLSSSAATSTTAGASAGIVAGVGEGAAIAGGGAVLPILLPIIAAAIGGFYLSKSVGNLVFDNIVSVEKFKKEAEILGKNVTTLKAYCSSMSRELANAISNINSATNSINKAIKKIQNVEYSTKNYSPKEKHLNNLTARKKELEAIAANMGAVNEILAVLNKNLSLIN